MTANLIHDLHHDDAPLPSPSRLDHCLEARLLADFRVACHGADPVTERLARLICIDPEGLVIRRVRFAHRTVTVVAMTGESWHSTACRYFTDRLREQASLQRRRVVLVPPSAVYRRPHLDGSMAIARCSHAFVPDEDRQAILRLLREERKVPLAACADVAHRSRAPMRTVLALAAARAIAIDVSRPLGPTTPVLARLTVH